MVEIVREIVRVAAGVDVSRRSVSRAWRSERRGRWRCDSAEEAIERARARRGWGRALQAVAVASGAARSQLCGRTEERARERERERKHVGWCRVVSPVVAVYGAERRAGEAAEPERRKGAEKCSGG